MTRMISPRVSPFGRRTLVPSTLSLPIRLCDSCFGGVEAGELCIHVSESGLACSTENVPPERGVPPPGSALDRRGRKYPDRLRDDGKASRRGRQNLAIGIHPARPRGVDFEIAAANSPHLAKGSVLAGSERPRHPGKLPHI